MRRLVVEIRLKDIAGMNGQETLLTAIQKIRSFKILNFLKQSREESAFICRLVFKDPSSKISDLPFFRLMKLQVLEQEKEKGTYTIFVKSKAQPQPKSKNPRTPSPEAYLTNLTISDEVIQATFLGNSKPIRSLLLRFEKLGTRCRIVSLMDARFPADSPLSRLTDRQLEILRTAHSLGYYDLPRKINSDQLASKLGLVNSTFVAHRRKAEQKILSEIFSSK